MRMDSSNASEPSSSRRTLATALAIGAIFALALFIRAYWNLDAAYNEGDFLLASGSDPYYHKRAIDYIQENGWQTLIRDPMLNYPYGANNPNPPLFQWSVAVAGAALEPFFADRATATWWAFEWAPAVWGALTVIPVYFLGRDLFDRKTGIIAALLLGLATSHIDSTGIGASDHDAMLLFFVVLAFMFYVRAVQGFKGDTSWVKDWRDGASISAGLGEFFRARRSPLLNSVLAGLSIGAVALIWKGFLYASGIVFAFAVVQMAVDHWRNKDSMGLFIGTLLTIAIPILLAYPAYSAAAILGFLKPAWFILGAFVIFGIVMVPTRDLPTILVMPIFLLVAGLSILAAFFVVPDVARQLLYATVYFKQTTLYKTIAEARPASFNDMTFAVGPIAFLLAIVGFGMAAWSAVKDPKRASLFFVIWAVIAVFMANSAVRFLFNATPVISLLAAFTVAAALEWLDFGSIPRNMASTSSFFAGLRRAVNAWHIAGAILIALLLVFPTVFLAVDAGAPPQYEDRLLRDSVLDAVKSKGGNLSRYEGRGAFEMLRMYEEEHGELPYRAEFIAKRFGAFGEGFFPEYWNEGLKWLATQDASLPPESRPGFLSWWDYGHWAIQVGKHPAVADNFQNGYVYAANFLLAENETAAVQLLAGRQAGLFERGVAGADGQPLTRAQFEGYLAEAGIPANETAAAFDKMKRFEFIGEERDLDKYVELLAKVEAATGKRIRYFATDFRMVPLDNPLSQDQIDYPSIFPAPVTLAEREVGDYVEVKIRGTDQVWHTEEEFDKLLRNPYAGRFGPTGQRYEYKDKFFNTMFWRGYAGNPVTSGGRGPILGDRAGQGLGFVYDGYESNGQYLSQLRPPLPGYGLEHFRLAYVNDQLRILEYTPGAVISGRVTEEGGKAVPNARVVAFDDAGQMIWDSLVPGLQNFWQPSDLNVPHGSEFTDQEGAFSLTAPWGAVQIVVQDATGVELGRANVSVSKEQAAARAAITQDITVQKGRVEGIAFYDRDNDNIYTPGNDTAVANLTVRLDQSEAKTDADGRFVFEGISAGTRDMNVDSGEYVLKSAVTRVAVKPGETTHFNATLELRSVEMHGVLFADADGDGALTDGEEVPSFILDLKAASEEGNTARQPTRVLRTDANGTFSISLVPGKYVAYANYTKENVTYTTSEVFEVPSATHGTIMQNDIRMTRVEK